MARFDEWDVSVLYETASTWRNESLLNGKSLLWPGESVWTLEALNAFKACFIDQPDPTTTDSFEAKFERQLDGQDASVYRLACELLLLHFLFTTSVSGKRKRAALKIIAGWKNLQIDDDAPIMKSLDRAIGGTGQAYNTRRPYEVSYIARVTLDLLSKDPAERAKILADDKRFAEVLEDVEGDSTFAGRHILLHLLFPEKYERIASGNHKALISEVFHEFLDGSGSPEDLDQRILSIRHSLEELLPGKSLDFYREPLKSCWYGAGEDEELSPVQALAIKRQVVLYGPPGTGKTYEGKALAETLLRQGILTKWKPKRYFTDQESVERVIASRIRRVQLHPGYGYEDLVRGLHLTDGGKTEYRNGVLLQIIEDMGTRPPEENDLPFVVILDEMNRADLSKVLGECFSLLEDRDGVIQLAGQDTAPRLVRMPPSLYFIGTMNLIDQSLEQVDFALRRRFLWFFRGFERSDFLAVAKYRWDELHQAGKVRRPWEKFEEEFEALADRAVSLNALIEGHHSLGSHYQIGHTYFCDVVAFAVKELTVRPARQRLLFNKKNEATAPVESLWKYSLRPLLEQYLSGVDGAERDGVLRQAQTALLKGDA